jgi:hypothetical protein
MDGQSASYYFCHKHTDRQTYQFDIDATVFPHHPHNPLGTALMQATPPSFTFLVILGIIDVQISVSVAEGILVIVTGHNDRFGCQKNSPQGESLVPECIAGAVQSGACG